MFRAFKVADGKWLPTYNLVIASNVNNYVIKTAAIAAGWNGTTKAKINVTINSGVKVGSVSTGSYAMDTGTSFPTGTIISITNSGTIEGMGGTGGRGGNHYEANWANGSAGGPAFLAQFACSITNNGIMAGGGGGGGGSAGYNGKEGSYGGNGGGGGAGINAGSGGTYGTGFQGNGVAGSAGTETGGGSGGGPGTYTLKGGDGGGRGAAGGSVASAGQGGAAGYCTSGSGSYITWLTTGTRYGTIG
jgi:hypothetical protein